MRAPVVQRMKHFKVMTVEHSTKGGALLSPWRLYKASVHEAKKGHFAQMGTRLWKPQGQESPGAQQVCAACHPAGEGPVDRGGVLERGPTLRPGGAGGGPPLHSPPRSPSLPQHLSSGWSSEPEILEPHRCLLGSEQMEKMESRSRD